MSSGRTRRRSRTLRTGSRVLPETQSAQYNLAFNNISFNFCHEELQKPAAIQLNFCFEAKSLLYIKERYRIRGSSFVNQAQDSSKILNKKKQGQPIFILDQLQF